MKKILTLVALLTCFLGAKAANWVEVYSIDFSNYTGFPHYVMGYVPEWYDGVMTDMGGNYTYATLDNEDGLSSEVTVTTNNGVEYYRLESSGTWHQYFVATGIPTELDGHYKAVAMIKASESCTVPMQMRWSWSEDPVSASATIGTEWTEIEWEYSGIGGTACDLIAQPNTAAQIEWQWVKVYQDQREQRPVTWKEWLTSDGQPVVIETTSAKIPTYMGNAEFGQWPAWSLEETDGINTNWRGERTGEICAWSLTMGRNFDDQCGDFGEAADRSRPYPADIEAEPGNPDNHVFAVHVNKIEKIDDDNSIQWSNQFWIQSPQGWKEGTQVRIKFRYKAEKACKTNTQIHKKYPSVYLHYVGVGDVNFTEQWQEFDKTITIDGSQATGWSLAFNLCADSSVDTPQEPNVFYFDDLSWETMVLDEGLFVASANTVTGIEYDFDNAKEFEYDEGLEAFVATVGEVGNKDSWVNEVMISTIRGNDTAFKGATLKPDGPNYFGEDNWDNYTAGSLAKIKLPAAGVWTISIDTLSSNKQWNFVKVEGEEDRVKLDENPNPTEIVVKGLERDWLGTNNEGNPIEEEVGSGQTWDNQFWIVANRALEKGEVTILKFKYKASVAAKTSTQCHADPGGYLHWGAIGDVNFTEEWQEFDQTFTVPNEADGMKSIAFNMAEIKEACDYYIKDVVWMTEDMFETLIDTEGTKNFYVKEGAGTSPYEFGHKPGPGVKGDVNGDGYVDIADISAVISVMADESLLEKYPNAYVNDDNVVDVADISAIITIMAEQARRAAAVIGE